MASKRKTNKTRWMCVRKMIKKIKSYGFQFTHCYGGGYFIFSFNPDEYNLHIRFKELPGMKFGIWKIKNQNYFFAEHLVFIDKFKPCYVSFNWDSLEDMMNQVSEMISNKETFNQTMIAIYGVSLEELEIQTKEERYLNSHNGFTQEEYFEIIGKFKEFLNWIDVEKFAIFWRKSDGYRNLYDVWYYPDWNLVTDVDLKQIEDKLTESHCFSFQWRLLPSDYWKRPWKYSTMYLPEEKKLFTNKETYMKTFNKNGN